MALHPEQLKLVKQQTHDWENIVIERKKHYRAWAIAVALSVSILSATSSILLGLKIESLGDVPRIVALIFTGIITIISSVNVFFNYKDLWIVNDTAKFKLNRLRFDIEMHQVKGTVTEEELAKFKDELEKILSELNSQWRKKRE